MSCGLPWEDEALLLALRVPPPVSLSIWVARRDAKLFFDLPGVAAGEERGSSSSYIVDKEEGEH